MASDVLDVEFLLGLLVVDRDDEDPDPAAVINTPSVPADEWTVDDEHTVASYPGNVQYPDDAPIAVVVFPEEIDEHGLAVDEPPLKLTELASQGVSYFAFPTPRLQIVGDGDGGDVAHVPPAAFQHSGGLNDSFTDLVSFRPVFAPASRRRIRQAFQNLGAKARLLPRRHFHL